MGRLIRYFRPSGAIGLIALAAMPAGAIALSATPTIAKKQFDRVHMALANVRRAEPSRTS